MIFILRIHHTLLSGTLIGIIDCAGTKNYRERKAKTRKMLVSEILHNFSLLLQYFF